MTASTRSSKGALVILNLMRGWQLLLSGSRKGLFQRVQHCDFQWSLEVVETCHISALLSTYQIKVKVTYAKTKEKWRYISNPFIVPYLKEVGGQHHVPAALPSEKTR